VRKILILALVLSALIIPVMGCGASKPLPEYSLEGITPQLRYYEWVYDYSDWKYLYGDPSGAKGPVMKEEIFKLDRNNDKVCDLKVFKYYVPEKIRKDKNGKDVTDKAYQAITLIIDDDLDKLWDRRLYDHVDASGNFGMDGVFEQEEAIRY